MKEIDYDSPEFRRILVETLWDVVWQGDPGVADPTGDRIFRRFIELGDDPGWDDWCLVGLVRPDSSVEWLPEAEAFCRGSGVAEAVAQGDSSGTIVEGHFRVQWLRSRGDGPPGDRVSDWAAN